MSLSIMVSLFFFSVVSGAEGINSVTLAEIHPQRMNLWPGQASVGGDKTEDANAFISIYNPSNANGAAVIICPGGGYGILMKEPEGFGIAKWFNQHDITGIVLEYRLPRGDPYRPLYDVQRAIRTVRAHAQKWNLDPKRIGILGFSAGGHLASTAATHFDSGDPKSADVINEVSCRPDFAILIYPVITMGPKAHNGTKENLLGRQPQKEMVEFFSSEKQVTNKTPPTFLAHAEDDRLVSPDNSQCFYDALLVHGVAARYLKLPSGGHGLNHYQGPMWEAWQTQTLEWLTELKILP